MPIYNGIYITDNMGYNFRLQKRIKAYITALIIAVFSFVIVNTAYGWFEIMLDEDTVLDFGNGEAAAVIDFAELRGTDADGNHTYWPDIQTPVYTAGEIVFSFDENISLINYWSFIRVRILYKGIGSSYLRVCIVEEWTDKITGKGLRLPRGGYSIRNDLWIDRSVEEHYYYYCNSRAAAGTDPYEVYQQSLTGAPVEIEFIFNGPTVQLPQQYANRNLRLKILVETAQSNRVSALWGIDAMPVR